MSLYAAQRAFLDEISGDDDAPPWSPGMAIYRNAYRARLSDALATSFERTKRWVGDDAFAAASAHYIIVSPPSRWSLDDYGQQFPEVLAELFAQNPEVGELAWLEWHMQRAFAARDQSVLDLAGLTAAAGNGFDFENAPLALVASFSARHVTTACTTLWLALAGEDGDAVEPAMLPCPAQLIVWRTVFAPHFRLLEPLEQAALEAVGNGESFGQICSLLAQQVGDEQAAAVAGGFLSLWIAEGLLADMAGA